MLPKTSFKNSILHCKNPKILCMWQALACSSCVIKLQYTFFWLIQTQSKGKRWSKMRKTSVCCTLYPRNHTPYHCHFLPFWYTLRKKWYLLVFFSIFQNFEFPGCQGVKGQKMAQNDKTFCLLYLIFQEPYIMVFISGTHV